MSDVPHLDCPECGHPLLPADGRGHYDDDGGYHPHAASCRCHRCEWTWTEGEPVTCECGAVACVGVDDSDYDGPKAYAKLITPCTP